MNSDYADDRLDREKSIIYTANKIDQNKVDRDNSNMRIQNSIDKRIEVDHTFTTTNPETFKHMLGRTPRGFIPAVKSANATIYGDVNSWTDQNVTLTASAQPVTVRFIFF